jgi:hypothetical protein
METLKALREESSLQAKIASVKKELIGTDG